MKLLMVLAPMALPLAALAEDNPLVGRLYSKCVQWTTFNGVATSKKFNFTYGDDGTALLMISFFENTASCEGAAQTQDNYLIKISDSSGDNLVKILNGHEDKMNLYYKIILTPNYVSIYSSETLPVKPDYLNTIYLKRAN
jgi:hypothetical protein